MPKIKKNITIKPNGRITINTSFIKFLHIKKHSVFAVTVLESQPHFVIYYHNTFQKYSCRMLFPRKKGDCVVNSIQMRKDIAAVLPESQNCITLFAESEIPTIVTPDHKAWRLYDKQD
jgi:hypothetical protein